MGLTAEINTPAIKSSSKLWTALFFVALALVIITRVLFFLEINIHYIDSDQPFMWAGAVDYSRGIFMEPRFYGQDYNTFIEGLLAVPLLWMGIPVYYALPIATHFMSLFPFLFASVYLLRCNKKLNALLILCVLLCVTPTYDIINCLPRGFISGLFFASFFIISFLHPQNIKWVLFNLLMAALGLIVNPNSILVSAPFVLFLFLHHYKNVRFYIALVTAFSFLLLLHYFFDGFYKSHPNYVIFGIQPELSAAFFFKNLSAVNDLFAHINFFTVRFGAVLLLYLSFLAFILWKAERKAFLALSSFLILVLLTFFSGKMQDGKLWPFYSYSRMYLGIPLLLCLLLCFVPLKAGRLFLTLVLVTFCFGAYKISNVKTSVAFHTRPQAWFGVHLVSLKQAREAIDFYRDVCKKQQAEFFLISNGFWLNTFLNYGGPAIYPDFPPSQETNSERRYWVRNGNKNKVYKQFVFLSATYSFEKSIPQNPAFELQKLDNYGLFVVKNNTLPLADFIALVKKAEAGT